MGGGFELTESPSVQSSLYPRASLPTAMELTGPIYEAATRGLQKYLYIGGIPQAVKTYAELFTPA